MQLEVDILNDLKIVRKKSGDFAGGLRKSRRSVRQMLNLESMHWYFGEFKADQT